MHDDTKPIAVSAEQAETLVPLLRDEAARLQKIGDGLILGTNNRRAGFNSHDRARTLLDLADRLDAEFPEVDEPEDDAWPETHSGDS